jgi:hypothetical protein
MSDEADETIEDRIERLQRRAENFRELLEDGDEITVALMDGEMRVAESYRSQFERKHPKLFGRMLSIEAMMRASWSPYVIALLAIGVFIFGLQLSWWEGLFGTDMTALLDTWWFYLIATAFMLYLAYVARGLWGRFIYRRHRQALHDLIAQEKLDRDVLVVMLRDEELIEHVVHELKMDTEPFPVLNPPSIP